MRMVKKTYERQNVQFSRTQLTQITFLICVPINYIHNFKISEMPKKLNVCVCLKEVLPLHYAATVQNTKLKSPQFFINNGIEWLI